MKCMNCSAEMPLRAEHCPRCGMKSHANFDMLAASVHDDAAVRRGLRIEDALRWTLGAAILAAAVFYAFNDLYDRPLPFDGSAVPAIPAGIVANPEIPTLDKGYEDPRPNPTVPGHAARVFGYRTEPIRSSLLHANKGDVAPDKSARGVREAIDLGLKFLSHNQLPDGSFPVAPIPSHWAGYDTVSYQWGKVGVTSLALLAFLGDGETWVADGPKKSPYEKQVHAGIKWLAEQQDPATGVYGPSSGDGVNFMYNHGMATLAMCEAAGLTGDEYLRDSAQRGINYIVKSQNALNGWNYYGSPDGEADTSVSAWQVQALYAGREAGLDVPDDTIKRALDMYQKATQTDGRVVYGLKFDTDKAFRPSLCGAGLMARLLLGDDPHAQIFRTMGTKLAAAEPKTQNNWGEGWAPNARGDNDIARKGYDPYTMYFGTYGLFLLGGKDWDAWHDGMKKSLIEMQSSDGCWRTNDIWSNHAGMIFSTALSVMTLQVYYRIH